MSPELFRKLMKPRLIRLGHQIKEIAPHAALFFHSCGNVRELIPDFIEAGVDILNPVHVTATGMDPVALKRGFSDSLVFWGGGYVFTTIDNIQPDVPPENIVAMREAIDEY